MPLVRYIGLEGLEKSPVYEAAEILNNGGVIIYPTETLYGMGTDAYNIESIKRINEIKGRTTNEPQIILLRWEWLPKYIDNYEPFLSLIDSFLPGPLSIITYVKPNTLPQEITPGGKIAFRISSSWFVDMILEQLGRPITSTSVNISGEDPLVDSEEIISMFWDLVNGIFIYHNISLQGAPSTIVDVREFPKITIEREGIISRDAIERIIEIEG